jgi:hypothetical protein
LGFALNDDRGADVCDLAVVPFVDDDGDAVGDFFSGVRKDFLANQFACHLPD